MQIRALARITLAPLVETLPCLGAVQISLLEEPHIDFSVHVFGSWDLMLLPILRDAVKVVAMKVGNVLRSTPCGGQTVSAAELSCLEYPMWKGNVRCRAPFPDRYSFAFSRDTLYGAWSLLGVQMKGRSITSPHGHAHPFPCLCCEQLQVTDTSLERVHLCLLQVLGDLLVYPNRMSFDIMPGGGKPPDPVGLLVIKVKSVSNIKGGGDLFSKVRGS